MEIFQVTTGLEEYWIPACPGQAALVFCLPRVHFCSSIIKGLSCLNLAHLVSKLYSKEPKNETAFDLFTFFRTDLIQSEASWKLSSTFDWLMSAWKNVSKKIHLSRGNQPKSALRLPLFFFLLVHVLTQLLLKLSRRGEKNALTVTLRVCLHSYKYK